MRALLIEDEPELAGMVAAAAGGLGLAVDTAASLEDARAALAAVDYDLVVLDLGLPDGDGVTLLREARARGNTVPVLVLTARDAPEARVAGLDAGADDYVLKPFHMPELLARLRALLRRPRGALAMRLEVGNVVFDAVHRRVEVDGRPVSLARRELALLELLMRRPGRVLTRDAIEAHLYGFEEEVGPNAMEVNVHRVRRKLAAAGASAEIHTLRGVGYLLDARGP